MLNWFLDIGLISVFFLAFGLSCYTLLVTAWVTPHKYINNNILNGILAGFLTLMFFIPFGHFLLSCSDNTRQMVSEMFSKKLNIPNEEAYYMLSYNIGLKICEINNFNGNTCLEYLKYVENKLLDWKNKDTEKRIKAEEERIKAKIKAEEEERLKKQAIEKAINSLYVNNL